MAGLGHYSPIHAQLLSVPPFAVAFVCQYFNSLNLVPFELKENLYLVPVAIISAVISDRFGARGYTMIFFSLMSLAGFAMFLGVCNATALVSHRVRSADRERCMSKVLSQCRSNMALCSCPYLVPTAWLPHFQLGTQTMLHPMCDVQLQWPLRLS